ncbi:MAG TPA: ABC transporter permease, partial [Vicinamibacterales bacterium]|nr:ABC transporter permease [Vicinamibacterales bacterium]
EAIEPAPLTLAGTDFPETVNGQRINASLPRFLGVPPLLGRPFLAEEVASSQPLALISESVWQNRYGGRRDVIGQSIRVDGMPRQIVGVLPDILNRPLGAFFVKTDGVWLPIDEAPSQPPGRHDVWALARLAPGTSLAMARQELLDLSTRLRETDAFYRDWLITATPLTVLVEDRTRSMLYLLLAAVAIVLMTTAANLSHLSLVHASARTHEIAVREALGASKRQVWQQVFAEGCIHVALSTIVGVLLGAAVLRVLILIRPRDLSEVEVVGLSWHVLALCLILSAAMVLAGFCVPMLRSAKRGGGVAHVLRTGSGTLLSMSAPRRAALITSETCLALILLLATGVLVGRVRAVSTVDAGFTPAGLVSATVNLPRGRYPSLASSAEFIDRLVDRVRAVPGVEAATIGFATPPTYATAFGRIEWEGRARTLSDTVGARRAENRVRPEYFRIVGARLTAGRFFEEGETGVAVINATMASYFWGPSPPIGRRFRVGAGAWQTVVGVVQDMQVVNRIGAPGFQVHVPASTVPPSRVLVVRTASDPARVLPSIRAAIAELDPDVTLRRIARVEDELKSLSARLRFVMLVVASLAALAVVLAAMGGLRHHQLFRGPQLDRGGHSAGTRGERQTRGTDVREAGGRAGWSRDHHGSDCNDRCGTTRASAAIRDPDIERRQRRRLDALPAGRLHGGPVAADVAAGRDEPGGRPSCSLNLTEVGADYLLGITRGPGLFDRVVRLRLHKR